MSRRTNSAAGRRSSGSNRIAEYERHISRQVALACDLWLRKRGIPPGSIVTGKEWLASQKPAQEQDDTKGGGVMKLESKLNLRPSNANSPHGDTRNHFARTEPHQQITNQKQIWVEKRNQR